MALVVFLRGVNVGGHKAFQPSALAREMADLDLVNIGAAGTFVVRKAISQAALRAALAGKLPIQAEMMICRAREILDLASGQPFQEEDSDQDIKQYVSVLASRPGKLPPLPIHQPAGAGWQVKVIGVTGRFALSLARRLGKTILYPNEVVEKRFGLSATTRNWNTIKAICEVLKS